MEVYTDTKRVVGGDEDGELKVWIPTHQINGRLYMETISDGVYSLNDDGQTMLYLGHKRKLPFDSMLPETKAYVERQMATDNRAQQ